MYQVYLHFIADGKRAPFKEFKPMSDEVMDSIMTTFKSAADGGYIFLTTVDNERVFFFLPTLQKNYFFVITEVEESAE